MPYLMALTLLCGAGPRSTQSQPKKHYVLWLLLFLLEDAFFAAAAPLSRSWVVWADRNSPDFFWTASSCETFSLPASGIVGNVAPPAPENGGISSMLFFPGTHELLWLQGGHLYRSWMDRTGSVKLVALPGGAHPNGPEEGTLVWSKMGKLAALFFGSSKTHKLWVSNLTSLPPRQTSHLGPWMEVSPISVGSLNPTASQTPPLLVHSESLFWMEGGFLRRRPVLEAFETAMQTGPLTQAGVAVARLGNQTLSDWGDVLAIVGAPDRGFYWVRRPANATVPQLEHISELALATGGLLGRPMNNSHVRILHTFLEGDQPSALAIPPKPGEGLPLTGNLSKLEQQIYWTIQGPTMQARVEKLDLDSGNVSTLSFAAGLERRGAAVPNPVALAIYPMPEICVNIGCLYLRIFADCGTVCADTEICPTCFLDTQDWVVKTWYSTHGIFTNCMWLFPADQAIWLVRNEVKKAKAEGLLPDDYGAPELPPTTEATPPETITSPPPLPLPRTQTTSTLFKTATATTTSMTLTRITATYTTTTTTTLIHSPCQSPAISSAGGAQSSEVCSAMVRTWCQEFAVDHGASNKELAVAPQVVQRDCAGWMWSYAELCEGSVPASSSSSDKRTLFGLTPEELWMCIALVGIPLAAAMSLLLAFCCTTCCRRSKKKERHPVSPGVVTSLREAAAAKSGDSFEASGIFPQDPPDGADSGNAPLGSADDILRGRWQPNVSATSAAAVAGRLTEAMRRATLQSATQSERWRWLDDVEDILRTLGTALPATVRGAAWAWHARQTSRLQSFQGLIAAREETQAIAEEFRDDLSQLIESSVRSWEASSLAAIAGASAPADADDTHVSEALLSPAASASICQARQFKQSLEQIWGRLHKITSWRENGDERYGTAELLRGGRLVECRKALDRLWQEHAQASLACREAQAEIGQDQSAGAGRAWQEVTELWRSLGQDLSAFQKAWLSEAESGPGNGLLAAFREHRGQPFTAQDILSVEPDCEPPPGRRMHGAAESGRLRSKGLSIALEEASRRASCSARALRRLRESRQSDARQEIDRLLWLGNMEEGRQLLVEIEADVEAGLELCQEELEASSGIAEQGDSGAENQAEFWRALHLLWQRLRSQLQEERSAINEKVDLVVSEAQQEDNSSGGRSRSSLSRHPSSPISTSISGEVPEISADDFAAGGPLLSSAAGQAARVHADLESWRAKLKEQLPQLQAEGGKDSWEQQLLAEGCRSELQRELAALSKDLQEAETLCKAEQQWPVWQRLKGICQQLRGQLKVAEGELARGSQDEESRPARRRSSLAVGVGSSLRASPKAARAKAAAHVEDTRAVSSAVAGLGRQLSKPLAAAAGRLKRCSEDFSRVMRPGPFTDTSGGTRSEHEQLLKLGAAVDQQRALQRLADDLAAGLAECVEGGASQEKQDVEAWAVLRNLWANLQRELREAAASAAEKAHEAAGSIVLPGPHRKRLLPPIDALEEEVSLEEASVFEQQQQLFFGLDSLQHRPSSKASLRSMLGALLQGLEEGGDAEACLAALGKLVGGGEISAAFGSSGSPQLEVGGSRRGSLLQATRRLERFDEKLHRQKSFLSRPEEEEASLVVTAVPGDNLVEMQRSLDALHAEHHAGCAECENALEAAVKEVGVGVENVQEWRKLMEHWHNRRDSLQSASSELEVRLGEGADEHQQDFGEAAQQLACFEEELQKQQTLLEKNGRGRQLGEPGDPLLDGQLLERQNALGFLERQYEDCLQRCEHGETDAANSDGLAAASTKRWRRLVSACKDARKGLAAYRTDLGRMLKKGTVSEGFLAKNNVTTGRHTSDEWSGSPSDDALLAKAARQAASFEDQLHRQRAMLDRKKRSAQHGEPGDPLLEGQLLEQQRLYDDLVKHHEEKFQHSQQSLQKAMEANGPTAVSTKKWQKLVDLWQHLRNKLDSHQQEVNETYSKTSAGSKHRESTTDTSNKHLVELGSRNKPADSEHLLQEAAMSVARFEDDLQQQRALFEKRRRKRGAADSGDPLVEGQLLAMEGALSKLAQQHNPLFQKSKNHLHKISKSGRDAENSSRWQKIVNHFKKLYGQLHSQQQDILHMGKKAGAAAFSQDAFGASPSKNDSEKRSRRNLEGLKNQGRRHKESNHIKDNPGREKTHWQERRPTGVDRQAQLADTARRAARLEAQLQRQRAQMQKRSNAKNSRFGRALFRAELLEQQKLFAAETRKHIDIPQFCDRSLQDSIEARGPYAESSRQWKNMRDLWKRLLDMLKSQSAEVDSMLDDLSEPQRKLRNSSAYVATGLKTAKENRNTKGSLGPNGDAGDHISFDKAAHSASRLESALQQLNERVEAARQGANVRAVPGPLRVGRLLDQQQTLRELTDDLQDLQASCNDSLQDVMKQGGPAADSIDKWQQLCELCKHLGNELDAQRTSIQGESSKDKDLDILVEATLAAATSSSEEDWRATLADTARRAARVDDALQKLSALHEKLKWPGHSRRASTLLLEGQLLEQQHSLGELASQLDDLRKQSQQNLRESRATMGPFATCTLGWQKMTDLANYLADKLKAQLAGVNKDAENGCNSSATPGYLDTGDADASPGQTALEEATRLAASLEQDLAEQRRRAAKIEDSDDPLMLGQFLEQQRIIADCSRQQEELQQRCTQSHQDALRKDGPHAENTLKWQNLLAICTHLQKRVKAQRATLDEKSITKHAFIGSSPAHGSQHWGKGVDDEEVQGEAALAEAVLGAAQFGEALQRQHDDWVKCRQAGPGDAHPEPLLAGQLMQQGATLGDLSQQLQDSLQNCERSLRDAKVTNGPSAQSTQRWQRLVDHWQAFQQKLTRQRKEVDDVWSLAMQTGAKDFLGCSSDQNSAVSKPVFSDSKECSKTQSVGSQQELAEAMKQAARFNDEADQLCVRLKEQRHVWNNGGVEEALLLGQVLEHQDALHGLLQEHRNWAQECNRKWQESLHIDGTDVGRSRAWQQLVLISHRLETVLDAERKALEEMEQTTDIESQTSPGSHREATAAVNVGAGPTSPRQSSVHGDAVGLGSALAEAASYCLHLEDELERQQAGLERRKRTIQNTDARDPIFALQVQEQLRAFRELESALQDISQQSKQGFQNSLQALGSGSEISQGWQMLLKHFGKLLEDVHISQHKAEELRLMGSQAGTPDFLLGSDGSVLRPAEKPTRADVGADVQNALLEAARGAARFEEALEEQRAGLRRRGPRTSSSAAAGTSEVTEFNALPAWQAQERQRALRVLAAQQEDALSVCRQKLLEAQEESEHRDSDVVDSWQQIVHVWEGLKRDLAVEQKHANDSHHAATECESSIPSFLFDTYQSTSEHFDAFSEAVAGQRANKTLKLNGDGDDIDALMREAARRAVQFDEELERQRAGLRRRRRAVQDSHDGDPFLALQLAAQQSSLDDLKVSLKENKEDYQCRLQASIRADGPHGAAAKGWQQVVNTWRRLEGDMNELKKHVDGAQRAASEAAPPGPLLDIQLSRSAHQGPERHSSTQQQKMMLDVSDAERQAALAEAARRAAQFEEELERQRAGLKRRRRALQGESQCSPVLAWQLLEQQQTLRDLELEAGDRMQMYASSLQNVAHGSEADAASVQGWQQVVNIWERLQQDTKLTREQVDDTHQATAAALLPCMQQATYATKTGFSADAFSSARSPRPSTKKGTVDDDDIRGALAEAAKRAARFEEELECQRLALKRRRRAAEASNFRDDLLAGQLLEQQVSLDILARNSQEDARHCKHKLQDALQNDGKGADHWSQLVQVWDQLQKDLSCERTQLTNMQKTASDSGIPSFLLDLQVSISENSISDAAVGGASGSRRTMKIHSSADDMQGLLAEATRRAARFEEDLERQKAGLKRRNRQSGNAAIDDFLLEAQLLEYEGLCSELEVAAQECQAGFNEAAHQDGPAAESAHGWQQLVQVWERFSHDVTTEINQIREIREATATLETRGQQSPNTLSDRHEPLATVARRTNRTKIGDDDDDVHVALSKAIKRIARFEDEMERQRAALKRRQRNAQSQEWDSEDPLFARELLEQQSILEEMEEGQSTLLRECRDQLEDALKSNGPGAARVHGWQAVVKRCEDIHESCKKEVRRRKQVFATVSETERQAALAEAARRTALFQEDIEEQRAMLKRRKPREIQSSNLLLAGALLEQHSILESLAEKESDALQEYRRFLQETTDLEGPASQNAHEWQRIISVRTSLQEELDACRTEVNNSCVAVSGQSASNESHGSRVDAAALCMASGSGLTGQSHRNHRRSDSDEDEQARRATLAEAVRRAARFDHEVERQRAGLGHRRRRRSSSSGSGEQVSQSRSALELVDEAALQALVAEKQQALAACEQSVVQAADTVEGEAWHELKKLWQGQLQMGLEELACEAMCDMPTQAEIASRTAKFEGDDEARAKAMAEARRRLAALEEEADRQHLGLAAAKRKRRPPGQEAKQRELNQLVEAGAELDSLAAEHSEALKQQEQALTEVMEADKQAVNEIEAWRQLVGLGELQAVAAKMQEQLSEEDNKAGAWDAAESAISRRCSNSSSTELEANAARRQCEEMQARLRQLKGEEEESQRLRLKRRRRSASVSVQQQLDPAASTTIADETAARSCHLLMTAQDRLAGEDAPAAWSPARVVEDLKHQLQDLRQGIIKEVEQDRQHVEQNRDCEENPAPDESLAELPAKQAVPLKDTLAAAVAAAKERVDGGFDRLVEELGGTVQSAAAKSAGEAIELPGVVSSDGDGDYDAAAQRKAFLGTWKRRLAGAAEDAEQQLQLEQKELGAKVLARRQKRQLQQKKQEALRQSRPARWRVAAKQAESPKTVHAEVQRFVSTGEGFARSFTKQMEQQDEEQARRLLRSIHERRQRLSSSRPATPAGPSSNAAETFSGWRGGRHHTEGSLGLGITRDVSEEMERSWVWSPHRRASLRLDMETESEQP